MVCLDFVFAAIIGGFIFDSQDGVYDCSPKLYWVGISFLVYQACFILRNILIVVVCYHTPKPQDYSLLARVVFNFLDVILLSALVSWNTYVMSLKETT